MGRNAPWSRAWIARAALSGCLAIAACGDDGAGVVTCDPALEECGCARQPCSPAVELGDLGRHTRVAPLSDGGQVVATWDATKTNLVVVFVDAAGVRTSVEVVAGVRRASDAVGERLVDVDAGRWASVAVGAGDVVHVAWFDADEGELHYAQGTAARGFSAPEVVDGDGPAIRGTHASLALDAAGLPHIAYRDETRASLRYARRDAAGAWQTRGLDGCAGEPGCPVAPGAGVGEDYGEHAALAFVPAAGGGVLPRVAFYDRLRGDLKMAAQAADGTWTTSTLDGRDPTTFADTGDVGRFISIAATPTRQLGLAYFDAGRGTLVYLGPGAAPRTVDDGRREARDGGLRRSAVGQHVRLRYDAAGRAHFVYADASAPGLRHAVLAGEGAAVIRALPDPAGGWIDLVVQGQALVGHYGAFVANAAPRTTLRRLVVSLEGAP
ncbi:MAG: hypothetical protein IT385_16315 [Deltaproteobacteria bacterium]|nr:hypothetical protein [Deltaproteobacteria bacterium]